MKNDPPSMRPRTAQRCYVSIHDPVGNKREHTTIYGLKPAEVLEALQLGVEEMKRRLPDAA